MEKKKMVEVRIEWGGCADYYRMSETAFKAIDWLLDNYDDLKEYIQIELMSETDTQVLDI